MKNKLTFGLIILGMIFLTVMGLAQTPEQELAELEQELTDASYEWFINNENLFKYVNYYTIE